MYTHLYTHLFIPFPYCTSSFRKLLHGAQHVVALLLLVAFGQCIRQVQVVACNAGHLLEEAVFGFIAHAPEWHKWPKSVTILIMVIYSYIRTYNRLFFIPSNYYLTVLDFVCFVMHFYQLFHTFTVNKHKSR